MALSCDVSRWLVTALTLSLVSYKVVGNSVKSRRSGNIVTSVRNPPYPALWQGTSIHRWKQSKEQEVWPHCYSHLSGTRPPEGGHSQHHSPSTLLLQLGAEEQVSEQEDVTKFAGPLHQLHHEAVLQ